MAEDGLKFFPLIIDRWVAGTRFLGDNPTENLLLKGVYLELLIYLYEGRGRVIKDRKHASRILGVHPNRGGVLWDKVADKFVRNQWGYSHTLVQGLLRNGGKVKGLGTGAYGGGEGGGFADSTSTSTRTPVVPLRVPQGVDEKAWNDFEQHRKEIRKPLTNLSRTKAANQLLGLSADQQRHCVDMTIQNRWQGLFPDKAKNNSSTPTNPESWRNDL